MVDHNFVRRIEYTIPTRQRDVTELFDEEKAGEIRIDRCIESF